MLWGYTESLAAQFLFALLQVVKLKIICTDSTEAFSKLRSAGFEPSLAKT